MRTRAERSARKEPTTPGRRARGSPPIGADTAELAIRATLTVAVMIGFLAGRTDPSNWLWGMNLLRYYPSTIGVIFLSVALAAIWLVPPLADDSPVARLLARANPVLAGLVAGVAALSLFMVFRTKSFLLGDGLELIRRLHQGEVPAPRSPLFNAIQPAFYRLLEQGEAARGGESAAAISFLAGFIGVAGTTFFLARLARRHAAAAVTCGVLLLVTGGLQLYFGYVEVYCLLAAASSVFMAAAFDRLTGGGRTALAGATLAAGMALLAHPFGTTLMPAWLYLATGRRDGERWRLNRRMFMAIVGGGLAVTLLLALLFAINPAWRAPGVRFRYLAPQVQVEGLLRGLEGFNNKVSWASEYTVISRIHASDCWNTLWLTGAAGLAVVAGALLTPAGRAAFRRPPVVLGLLGLIMITAYRIIWRTPLGAMRDWDLYAGLGVGVAALAAGLVVAGVGRRMAGPILAAALFFLVPWIGMQVDAERAARRHFDGVDAEPRPEPMIAAQFHGVMGDRFSSMRRFDLATRAYERALDLRPRHEYAWRLGMAHFAAHEYDKALVGLTRALELRPDDRTTLITLGEVSVDAGRVDEADRWLDRALVLYPESAAAWLQKGRNEQRRGRFDAAAVDYARADSLFSRTDRARRDLDRARTALEAARRLTPPPSIPQGAGETDRSPPPP